MACSQVDHALSEMDGDGNGAVSMHEFYEYFSSVSLGNVSVSDVRSDGNDGDDGEYDFRATKKAKVSRSAEVPD